VINTNLNDVLDTGIKLVRNVGSFNFGRGAVMDLTAQVSKRREVALANGSDDRAVYLIDEYFRGNDDFVNQLGPRSDDHVAYVLTAEEPTTDVIDQLTARLVAEGFINPATIVAVGGGITLDTAKAVANLLTNGGRAADYQGWDLVKVPGVHKIGVPTISGTGSEATRTCVMTNKKTGLKLGMNSDHTVFNHLVLDPDLTATVPRDQYFYTGMDAFIHCMESLAGSYRNAIGDAYSQQTLGLCRTVFLSEDMMAPPAREQLMVASYLGGSAIAASYVGVVHPFSAGLSVVLGLHHCVANCITMRAVEEYYPSAVEEFWAAAAKQKVMVPTGIAKNLSDQQYKALFEATVIHEKPLTNALGPNFRDILTFDKVVSMFQKM
jgi:3-deoxy-alpha-D-manno-octulosonate 8-oxidase